MATTTDVLAGRLGALQAPRPESAHPQDAVLRSRARDQTAGDVRPDPSGHHRALRRRGESDARDAFRRSQHAFAAPERC